MTEQTEQAVDAKDLKIRALLERITELEERDADRRVTITILGQRVQELTSKEEVVELPDVEEEEASKKPTKRKD